MIDLIDKKQNYTTVIKSLLSGMAEKDARNESPLVLYQLNQTEPGYYRLNVSSLRASTSYYNVTIKSAPIYWHGIDVHGMY